MENQREHLPCLDGLRGLAAVMVVLGHASGFGLPLLLAAQASDYGVLVFFALSGFLMGHLYLLKPPTAGRMASYAVARAARIVPIYYLVVVAAFAIRWVDPGFVYAVTPIQLVRLLTFNGSASVFWSIGPEVQFYALFAGLWLARDRLRNDAVFATLALALCAFSLLTIRHWPGVFVLSKAHIFAAGMLAALLRHHAAPVLPRAVVPVLHLGAYAGLALILVPGLGSAVFAEAVFDPRHDPGFVAFYGSVPRLLLACGIIFALSFGGRLVTPVFANRGAAWLGACSFSVYLLHEAVYYGLGRLGAFGGLPGWGAVLLALGATVAVSAATFVLIERPAQAAIKAWSLRRRAAPPGGVAA